MEYEGARIWSENKLITFTKDHHLTATHKYELTFLNIYKATKHGKCMPIQSYWVCQENHLNFWIRITSFFFDANRHQKLNENIRSIIMEPAFKIPWVLKVRGGEIWGLIPGILLQTYL